ncbi:hypothetical protein [Marinobacter sp. ATCH36]|uniref:hypothetical protein n=1 Tax=Marinobacter sp. ATCH36 TaxID=2945106 RepID=UPI0020208BC9|nr:hypothetical protein [Marinobacter sp. ATCH36]MCL7942379.1 hypothetical protein [Marinobacter sp. ATCH36]
MPNNLGITERVEEIREKSPVDAAESLAKLAPDEIQFVLSRLPHEQAMDVASHLAESVGAEDLATKAVLSGVEETIGELMTPAPIHRYRRRWERCSTATIRYTRLLTTPIMWSVLSMAGSSMNASPRS